jgi:glycopeptide antibiotics resistance protein
VATEPVGAVVRFYRTVDHHVETFVPQTLWILYALFIVYATTLPFQFELDVPAAIEELSRIPLSPLAAIEQGPPRPSITDMVQNVVLFVPFGILGLLSLQRRGQIPILAVALVTLLGTALSVAVEVLQLFTPYRITSANDVMTNTIGSCLGAVAMLVAAPVAHRGAAMLGWMDERARPAFSFVLATATLLIVAAWHPFDASLRLGGIAFKLRELLADPWQVGIIADQGGDFLRYALFAMAMVVWMRVLDLRRPVQMAALAGAAAAFLVEMSQIVIWARMPGLADAMVGAAGAAAGAFAEPRIRSWRPARPMVLLVVLGVLAAAMMLLSPFEVTDERRAVQWMPFIDYLGIPPSRAVSNVAELVIAFAPVGYALRRLMPGRSGWVGVTLTALVLGGALEYLQGGVSGRYPDVTDVGMLVWGALLGAGAADWVAGPESSRSQSL